MIPCFAKEQRINKMKTTKIKLSIANYHLIIALITLNLGLLTINSFSQATRLWATYYGGGADDRVLSVITDAVGNVYIGGYTNSSSGIASGGFQNSFSGGYDAFLVKFNAAGNRLWATYYGGAGDEYGASIIADASGDIYLAGSTNSTTGIASGGFQNTAGGGGNYDAFLVKFDAITGNRLWATYYGGTVDDFGYGVATDAVGNVYLAGSTNSTTGIASGGFQNTFGGFYDAYLVKFNASGNRLWATYYGGTDKETGMVSTDGLGNVYLGGYTGSTSGISSGGFQNSYGGGTYDAFLAKFDTGGVRLWATYYGDAGFDEGAKVTTDVSGNVYLAGIAGSTSNIASGGFQNIYGGGLWDTFLVKFNSSGNRLWATYYGGTGAEEAYDVATDASGNVYLAGDTYSATGIASGGFQNALGLNEDCFVATFDAAGNRICATYYGSTVAVPTTADDDEDGHIALDGLGNVYLSGNSHNAGLASGGFQNSNAGGTFDGFLVKFTSCAPPSVLSTVATATNILCNGQCTGTASATPSGGTPPYTYLWSPGAATASTATGLCAGTYSVLVTDAISGTITATVSVSQPAAPLTATITASSVACSGSSSASVNANGGTAGYTYSWNPGGQTTASVTGLSAGNYTATVTDANGCTTTATVTITGVAGGTVAITSQSNVLCNGGSTGSAVATMTGGLSPFTYSWNSGQTTSSVSNFPAGNYSVIVTDANGCTATQSVSITQPTAISASVTVSGTLCGSNTGSAIITASGGTGSLTYSWIPPVAGNTPTATGLAAGNYTCITTDANGCTHATSCTIVNTNGPAANISSQTNATCNGSANGTASATATGGTSPYTYLWNTTPAQTSQTATGLSAGTYTVTVADASGCSSTQTVGIIQPSVLTASTIATAASCGQSDGTASANANGGTPSYSYLWNNGQTTSSASGLSAGNYSVIITDVNGCSGTFTITISNSNGPTAAAGTSATITSGNSTNLTSSGGITYSWSPSNGLSCTNCSNPVASPNQTTTYCVIATDAGGCSDSACVTIYVELPCGNLFIPNAFSPNNDLANDIECVMLNPACVKNLTFIIYDRWGEKVFETTDVQICWDGMYKGKAMNTAVFVYYLEATFTSGETIAKKGNISLIR